MHWNRMIEKLSRNLDWKLVQVEWTWKQLYGNATITKNLVNSQNCKKKFVESNELLIMNQDLLILFQVTREHAIKTSLLRKSVPIFFSFQQPVYSPASGTNSRYYFGCRGISVPWTRITSFFSPSVHILPSYRNIRIIWKHNFIILHRKVIFLLYWLKIIL